VTSKLIFDFLYWVLGLVYTTTLLSVLIILCFRFAIEALLPRLK